MHALEDQVDLYGGRMMPALEYTVDLTVADDDSSVARSMPGLVGSSSASSLDDVDIGQSHASYNLWPFPLNFGPVPLIDLDAEPATGSPEVQSVATDEDGPHHEDEPLDELFPDNQVGHPEYYFLLFQEIMDPPTDTEPALDLDRTLGDSSSDDEW